MKTRKTIESAFESHILQITSSKVDITFTSASTFSVLSESLSELSAATDLIKQIPGVTMLDFDDDTEFGLFCAYFSSLPPSQPVDWEGLEVGKTYYSLTICNIPSLWEMTITHILDNGIVSYLNQHGHFSVQKDDESFLRDEGGNPMVFAYQQQAHNALLRVTNRWRCVPTNA